MHVKDRKRLEAIARANGCWHYVEPFSNEVDALADRLAEVTQANSEVNAQCMKEAARADDAEARLAEAEALLRDPCLFIVPDEAWQERRDAFLEIADSAPAVAPMGTGLCQPTLTECPACKNNLAKCIEVRTNSADVGPQHKCIYCAMGEVPDSIGWHNWEDGTRSECTAVTVTEGAK